MNVKPGTWDSLGTLDYYFGGRCGGGSPVALESWEPLGHLRQVTKPLWDSADLPVK